MTDDDIRAHVMKAEGVLDQIQDNVTGQFGEARKAIMAIDRAYSQLLSSRDFYREARNGLITDRDRWEAEAKEARAERDQLRRERERLRATGDQLKADNATLRSTRDRFNAANVALKGEVKKLRAGQGRWPECDDFPCRGGDCAKLQAEVDQLSHALRLASREKDEWEANYTELSDSTPRVIRAEELRYGLKIATFADDGYPVAGVVGGHASYGFSLLIHGDKVQEFSTDRTIVLLEDAPTTDTPTTDTPRLTVHALNTAPVGSYVTVQGEIAEKRSDGNWVGRGHFYSPESSEEIIRNGWDAATLTHPQRGDHE